MSICELPLAFFDLIFVPSYWIHVTIPNIPIVIEGFLFSFSVGGIAAVLYAELTKTAPRHVKGWRCEEKRAIWIPILALVAFGVAEVLGIPNPESAAYVVVTTAVVVTLFLRPDLLANAVWGSLTFGVVYFVCLKTWALLFPGGSDWFIFQGMPKLFIWEVPGWEAIFGFFFGAFWSTLYEVLFGCRLVPLKVTNTRSTR